MLHCVTVTAFDMLGRLVFVRRVVETSASLRSFHLASAMSAKIAVVCFNMFEVT